MSTGDRLVYMANQIGLNFAIAGEDAAALATADHIATFWDPHMRARLFARSDNRDSGLGAIATKAIALLKTRGAPPSQTGATEFSQGSLSQSDAG